MEHKYSASVEQVYGLLTDSRFLETRSNELGESSASFKSKKTAKGASVSMVRRIHRDLPAVVAKVLKPELELHIDERWAADGKGGYAGDLTMEIAGQPVITTARFSLEPQGKGAVYRIEHVTKCSIPLVGSIVAKFVQAKVEQGCNEEFGILVKHLKTIK